MLRFVCVPLAISRILPCSLSYDLLVDMLFCVSDMPAWTFLSSFGTVLKNLNSDQAILAEAEKPVHHYIYDSTV